MGDQSSDLSHVGLGHVANALPVQLQCGDSEGEQSEGEEKAGSLGFDDAHLI